MPKGAFDWEKWARADRLERIDHAEAKQISAAKAPVAPKEWCPELKAAQLALEQVLTDLTEVATEHTKQLVLGEGADEALIAEELERVSQVCHQIKVDAGMMNPRWNKAYGFGAGKTTWNGALKDNADRGPKPYYAPNGWCRFSLNVCPDSEFAAKFKGWGYAYHGTAGKNVGPILASGFMGASYDNWRVYMSPSIEYCSHWRYATPTWNAEIRKFVQTVLQCRVNPALIRKIQPETLCHDRWHLTHHKNKPIDINFSNSELEWLFDSEFKGADGKGYIKDAIVCTGLMIRLTDVDPNECEFWWSGSQQKEGLMVIPRQPRSHANWPKVHVKVMRPVANTTVDALLGDSWNLKFDTIYEGEGRLAPNPFSEGGMRVALYAHWQNSVYIVKRFNMICQNVLKYDYGETLEDGARRDINCQLLGKLLASQFSQRLVELFPELKNQGDVTSYIEPLLVQINGSEYVEAEECLDGVFEKYNSNSGWINPEKSYTGALAAAFCHWSWKQTQGKALVCDIQGVNTVWTDPQVHTGHVSRQDARFRRFGLGNHGKAGMMRFFWTHRCGGLCKKLGLCEDHDANEVQIPATSTLALSHKLMSLANSLCFLWSSLEEIIDQKCDLSQSSGAILN